MDADIVTFSINAFLGQLRERIEEASDLAEAADACARARQVAWAVEIANDLDEVIHDAGQLLGMATTLVRFARTGEAEQRAAVGPKAAPKNPTDAAPAAETMRAFLHQARERLNKAVGIARAAEMLAATVSASDAARLALDVEPLLNEASRLVDAASLMNRLSEEATTPS